MSGIATKLIIFNLFLTFTFSMVVPSIKTGSIGGGSETYNQTIATTTNILETKASDLFISSIPAGIVIAFGALTGNGIFVFAGIAATLLSLASINDAAINESFGHDFGLLFSTIMKMLWIFAIISWFGSKGDP